MIHVKIEEKCACGCNIIENDGIDYNDKDERCYVFSLDCEDENCHFSDCGFYDEFYALEPDLNTLIDKSAKLTSELIYKIQFECGLPVPKENPFLEKEVEQENTIDYENLSTEEKIEIIKSMFKYVGIHRDKDGYNKIKIIIDD